MNLTTAFAKGNKQRHRDQWYRACPETRVSETYRQEAQDLGRFELHCHSHYSKGTKVVVEGLPSPREMIIHAKRIGLGGIAITDHDTSKAWAEASAEAKKQGIIFIPAMEICSTAGHIIGLGLNEHIRSGMTAAETIDAIREQGAVSIAPHPFDTQNWGIRKFMDRTDAAEVFNALGIDRLGNMAAERRARKKGLNMVAGSDAHSLEMLGTACNRIEAGSVDEVLVAIRHGKASFEKNYIQLNIIIEWVRERMLRSYPEVNAYIGSHYRGPKAWVARRLLRDYVVFNKRGMERLACLGLAAATAYSAVRLLAYY